MPRVAIASHDEAQLLNRLRSSDPMHDRIGTFCWTDGSFAADKYVALREIRLGSPIGTAHLRAPNEIQQLRPDPPMRRGARQIANPGPWKGGDAQERQQAVQLDRGIGRTVGIGLLKMRA